jgi:prokaryotic ubiquitin-like protein Pup
MADQRRKPKPKKDEESAQVTEEERADTTTAEVDDLLDEIDEVLEINHEDFVRSYVQKGGQALAPLAISGDEPIALVLVLLLFLYLAWRRAQHT